jgi:microcystin-dependent protein
MTVESASFISGLNASYPPGSDTISEGDDHLRLIKSVLKATLPNADEAINGVHTGTTAPTPTSAGQLWFDTSGTGDLKVRDKADSAFASVDTTTTALPAGIIALWYGSSASIPAGWTLCDGSASTPDLRDRFVVGATTTYAVGATGGSTTSGSHTLLTAEMPAHVHDYKSRGFTEASSGAGGQDYSDETTNYPGGTGSTGGGGAHSHAATLPPYYALCYIMKT